MARSELKNGRIAMSSEQKPKWRARAVVLTLLAVAFLAHLVLFLRGVPGNSLLWMTLLVCIGLITTGALFWDKRRLAKLAAPRKDETRPNAIESRGGKKGLSTYQRIWLVLAICTGVGIISGILAGICERLFPESAERLPFIGGMFIGVFCGPLAVLVFARKPTPGEVFTDEREKMITARATGVAGVCLLCALLLGCGVVWFVCRYQRIDTISIDLWWLLPIAFAFAIGFSWTQVAATWFLRRRGAGHGED